MLAQVSIVWFKRDLRCADHQPLVQAAQGPIIPLYVIEPELWQQPDSSLRHWRFIRDSLVDLNDQLIAQGGRLIIRQGEITAVLGQFAQQYNITNIYSHEETGNAWSFARDKKVAQWCSATGVAWHEFQHHGVKRRLRSRDGWAEQRNSYMRQPIIKVSQYLNVPSDVLSEALPEVPHTLRAEAIGTVQPGGRARGIKVLDGFLEQRSRNYLATISKPGFSARHCSRLSAHIAYGTLSVREIEQAAQRALRENSDIYWQRSLRAFLSRLAWRCHFVQKLESQPELETQCMHPACEGLRPSEAAPELLEAWYRGQTGYPLIDAVMRSLHENGWVTFRMRAMVTSFASYHLWLDWRQTGPLLARLFTDYEPGIHYSQLQMQSGVTGINALRIYNPVKQSLEHAADGKFIRRFVPQLQKVPLTWLHEPWRMPRQQQESLEFIIGRDYPAPLVTHEDALRKARQAFKALRQQEGYVAQARKVYEKLGSRQKAPLVTRSTKTGKNQLSFDF
jgi:deoxyribodipyrimidine photo-lyase